MELRPLNFLPLHGGPQTGLGAPGTADTADEIWTGGEFFWDRVDSLY